MAIAGGQKNDRHATTRDGGRNADNVMSTSSSWAHRYGNAGRRLCARPGCGTPAAATLRFQPTRREAWLVDLDRASPRTEGDLCARHAAALTLPRGWELHDQRTHKSPADDAAAPPARSRTRERPSVRTARRRRVPRPDVALPGLEPETADAAPTPEPEPAVSDADAGAEPVTGPDPLVGPALEELADTLDAQTPLLRRAFQNVWPLDDSQ